jgi:hypothetical protein
LGVQVSAHDSQGKTTTENADRIKRRRKRTSSHGL